MSDRIPTKCDHCGQTDDHPKAHIGLVSKHHDCLSAAEKDALIDSAQAKGSGPKASAVIAACEGGTKGDDLLALILDPKTLPQAEGLHEKKG